MRWVGECGQRVALLRTYLLGHSVFLLDEAFSALDELVPVATDLQTYYESRTYLNDNYTKVKEVAPKYLAAVD